MSDTNDDDESLHSFYINMFAKQMIKKMDYKASEFDWNGWDKMDSHTLLYYFNKSVQKGDPVDIANYYMMFGD